MSIPSQVLQRHRSTSIKTGFGAGESFFLDSLVAPRSTSLVITALIKLMKSALGSAVLFNLTRGTGVGSSRRQVPCFIPSLDDFSGKTRDSTPLCPDYAGTIRPSL